MEARGKQGNRLSARAVCEPSGCGLLLSFVLQARPTSCARIPCQESFLLRTDPQRGYPPDYIGARLKQRCFLLLRHNPSQIEF